MDATTVITTAVADFGPQLLTIGGVGIAAAAGVLLLKKGWRLVSGLIK